eukprot:353540-Chlamydomonas_euryale.AAC.3
MGATTWRRAVHFRIRRVPCRAPFPAHGTWTAWSRRGRSAARVFGGPWVSRAAREGLAARRYGFRRDLRRAARPRDSGDDELSLASPPSSPALSSTTTRGDALGGDVRLRLSALALLAAAVATDVAAGRAISLATRHIGSDSPRVALNGER